MSTSSSSKKTTRPAPKSKAPPLVSLTGTKASAVPNVPTKEMASQRLAKVDTKKEANQKKIEKAPESKPCTEWTSQTKKSLEKNRMDLLKILDEEDTTALMTLDHFVVNIKSPFVPSKRNCSLDFWYEKANDGLRGAPVIKISTRCKCLHLYAGEHHLTGKRLAKGQLLPQTLAALANGIIYDIRKNWEVDICHRDEESEQEDVSTKQSVKVARTKRL